MKRFIVFFALLIAAPSFAADTYSIATGSPSGLYYPFGGGLAGIWSKAYDDLNIKAEVTGGSVVNIIQVAKGESELGISQGDALRQAIAGEGKYPEPMPVRALLALYPNVVHAITNAGSGIHTIDDLRGKRVSIGAPGSGTAITTMNILGILGITADDFDVQYLSYTETSDGLKNGTIDAGFMVGGIGLAAIVELALTRDISLIEFSDDEMAQVSAAFPAYSAFEVPAKTYGGVENAVKTITLWNFLIVHKDMPNELAYRLVQKAYESKSAMLQVTKVARFMIPENARAFAKGILHPAAEAYLSE